MSKPKKFNDGDAPSWAIYRRRIINEFTSKNLYDCLFHPITIDYPPPVHPGDKPTLERSYYVFIQNSSHLLGEQFREAIRNGLPAFEEVYPNLPNHMKEMINAFHYEQVKEYREDRKFYESQLQFYYKLLKDMNDKVSKCMEIFRSHLDDSTMSLMIPYTKNGDISSAWEHLNNYFSEFSLKNMKTVYTKLRSLVYTNEMNLLSFFDDMECLFELIVESGKEINDEEKIIYLEQAFISNPHCSVKIKNLFDMVNVYSLPYIDIKIKIKDIMAEYKSRATFKNAASEFSKKDKKSTPNPNSTQKAAAASTPKKPAPANPDAKKAEKEREIKICSHCHKPGHLVTSCYLKENEALKAEVKSLKAQIYANVTTTKSRNNESDDESAYVCTTEYEVARSAHDSSPSIIFDSGCSTHMFRDTSLVNNCEENVTNIMLGSSQFVIKSTHVGTSSILDKVLIVPDLKDGLISISKLDQAGFTTVFGNGEVHVFDANNTKILSGKLRNDNLYHVHDFESLKNATVIHGTATAVPKSYFNSIPSIEKFKYMHRALNHMNYKYVASLINSNKAIGMHMTSKDLSDHTPPCDVCTQGKMKLSTPVKSVLPTTFNSPFQRVSMDIVGPIDPISINKFKYYIIFKCHYSKFMICRLMKLKSESLNCLISFIKDYVSPFNYKIECLQSDSDTIFKAEDFTDYCASNHINQQFSPAYRHELNGVAERSVQTLSNYVRCNMIDQSAPANLWDYCVESTCYVFNRSFLNDLKETPFETVYKKLPDISNIVPFYSRGYYYVHEDRRKFDPKAAPCNVIGYDETSKNCYTVISESKRILTRHDLIIHPEFANSVTADIIVPTSLNEALNSKESAQWKEAINSEMNEIISRDTFTFVTDAPNQPLKSKLVLRIAKNMDGTTKFKARLVACGYSQKYGVDYLDTFSPTASFQSICIILHIAATFNYAICQLDVGNAYLEARLDSVIYMKLSDDLVKFSNLPSNIVKLNKSLYGLKQSGLMWFNTIKNILLLFGLCHCITDLCVFYITEKHLYVIVYVDDILIVCPSQGVIDDLCTHIESHVKKLKINKAPKNFKFLGINVERHGSEFHIHQHDYIQSILTEYQRGTRAKPTPISTDAIFEVSSVNYQNQPLYEVVGKLRFLADRTRPDLLFATSMLSVISANPTEANINQLHRCLMYLQGSVNKVLKLGSNDKVIQLSVFCDANFNRQYPKMIRYGLNMFLSKDSGVIFSKCIKEKSISLSSTESEIRALSESIKRIIYTTDFMNEIGFQQSNVVIHCDSDPSIKMIESSHNKRSMYFIPIVYFIRQYVADNTITLSFIKGEFNNADIHTKALPHTTFGKHVDTILGHLSHTDSTPG